MTPVLTPAERERLRGIIAQYGTRADMSAFLRLEAAAEEPKKKSPEVAPYWDTRGRAAPLW